MKKKPLKLKPAPDDLSIVEAFVNTADRRRGTDELSSPAALAAWLAGRGLLPPAAELSEEDLARAIAVREGLRALLVANHGGDADERAVRKLDRAMSGAVLQPRFAAAGPASLEPAAGGLDGALGRLAEIVYAAQRDGSWPRLKACFDGGCRRAFYDFSSNRSGKWCSMRRCGNRIHSETYRRRYKQRYGKWPEGGWRNAYP